MSRPTYDEAVENYQRMMGLYQQARRLIDAPEVPAPYPFWRDIEKLVRFAERHYLQMTRRDWEFPDSAHYDSLRWIRILAKARALQNGLDEMRVFGSRADTRTYLESGEGALRLCLDAARQDADFEEGEITRIVRRINQLDPRSAHHVNLSDVAVPDRIGEMASLLGPDATALIADRRPDGTYAPLGGQGIPSSPIRLGRTTLEYWWDGVAGPTYRAQFEPQIGAAGRLVEIANKAVFMLRGLRITYLDMIGSFIAVVLGTIGAIISLIGALTSLVFGPGGVAAAAVFAATFAGLVATALINLATFSKNHDSLTGAITNFVEDSASLRTADSVALPGGAWPDPLAHTAPNSRYVAEVVEDSDGSRRLVSPLGL